MKIATILVSSAVGAACALLNVSVASADEPPTGDPSVSPGATGATEVTPLSATTEQAPPTPGPAEQQPDAGGPSLPPVATTPPAEPVDRTSRSSTTRDREPTVRWHASIGAEILGGDGFSFGFRSNLGITRNLLPDARVSPSIGVLLTLGSSSISVNDTRALDGSLKIGQLDFGAGAQLGLSLHRVGFVESRLFVTGALLRVVVDDRLRFDQVAGIVDTPYGYRATAGVNWISALVASPADNHYGDRDEDLSWLAILLPHQVEFVWQRSAGSDRYGAALSWGF